MTRLTVYADYATTTSIAPVFLQNSCATQKSDHASNVFPIQTVLMLTRPSVQKAIPVFHAQKPHIALISPTNRYVKIQKQKACASNASIIQTVQARQQRSVQGVIRVFHAQKTLIVLISPPNLYVRIQQLEVLASNASIIQTVLVRQQRNAILTSVSRVQIQLNVHILIRRSYVTL